MFPLAHGLLSLEYRTSNSRLECFSFVVRRRLFLDLWALQSQEGSPHSAPCGSCGLSGGIQPQASSEGTDRINTWREWTLLLPVTPCQRFLGAEPNWRPEGKGSTGQVTLRGQQRGVGNKCRGLDAEEPTRLWLLIPTRIMLIYLHAIVLKFCPLNPAP